MIMRGSRNLGPTFSTRVQYNLQSFKIRLPYFSIPPIAIFINSENFISSSFPPASYFDRRKRPSLASSSSTSLSSSSSPATCVAAAYLVCYKISDPSTLFSAVNNWCPAIRARDPNAPIVLVGCQSELR